MLHNEKKELHIKARAREESLLGVGKFMTMIFYDNKCGVGERVVSCIFIGWKRVVMGNSDRIVYLGNWWEGKANYYFNQTMAGRNYK